MNVLQVAPRYDPHTGGVERHVQAISERLVRRGHDVEVLTADAGSDHPRAVAGVTVTRCHGLAPGGAYHFAPGIVRAVADRAPDVVHAHNYHSLPLVLASLRADDVMFVATPHYHGASASRVRDLLLRAYRPVGRRALVRADAVVAVSDWERRVLESDFGVDATVVPNGIDVDRFETATPEDRSRPYVLTVGRLEEYKGVQHLVRALPHLESDLVIAGDGPYRDHLERAAEDAGVADRVTLLGYVAEERLPGLYAGAEAYATLSAFESYGLTVGEALAAGTPCVVYERRALADWAPRADCVGVADRTPDTVATAVEAAVDGSAPSEALPTWDAAVDSLEAVYSA
jgi:glycosyltransferase involved in cell wall biosynthesis